MNNDIKEILDIIKKVSKAEVNSYNGLIETPPMKWEIFLDYITNLQEENERLNNIIDEIGNMLNEGLNNNKPDSYVWSTYRTIYGHYLDIKGE